MLTYNELDAATNLELERIPVAHKLPPCTKYTKHSVMRANKTWHDWTQRKLTVASSRKEKHRKSFIQLATRLLP